MATKSNPVVWFEIYTDNMARARKFYETVLGIELAESPVEAGAYYEMLFFPSAEDMSAPNASGALVRMNNMKAGGNGTVVYFSCDDCTIEESRVVGVGGTVIQPKMPIGEYGFISLCTDSEGNTFGLHSTK